MALAEKVKHVSGRLDDFEKVGLRMTVKAVQYSLRIKESLRDEIKVVSKYANVSMNQLIVDAIREYLPTRRKKIEQDLSQTLQLLKQYSDRDPNFDKAINEFAAAEVSGENPLEGKFFDVRTRGESSAPDAVETDNVKDLEEFLNGA